MKIAIMSRAPKLYSTLSLVKAAKPMDLKLVGGYILKSNRTRGEV